MSAEPNSQPNQPAPEGQANPPQPSNGVTTPAPGAGEDAAALKVQLDSLLKHKASLEADLKKYRDAKKEAEDRAAQERAAVEAKLKEQGDHVKLREIAEEKARALEAQLAQLSPKAEQYAAYEARAKDEIAKAKEAGGLPDYLVSLIDSVDPVRGVEALQKFRASQASAQPAPKQPAPPAPAPGGAPPSPAQPINMANPTVADLQRLKAEKPDAFRALIQGQTPATSTASSIYARLTGAARK